MGRADDGVLYHTQMVTTENRYWYDGVESGEIVQAALYAGQFGVPPISFKDEIGDPEMEGDGPCELHEPGVSLMDAG